MAEPRPRLFLVRETPGPDWDPARDRREQDGWDENAVRAILADDPWTGTVLAIESTVPWTIWVDGRAGG